jgi:hypothetical protein
MYWPSDSPFDFATESGVSQYVAVVRVRGNGTCKIIELQ